MASLTKAINKDLFDSILPTFGNQRVHIPVWDEGQKMFLCEEYESASGNRYYKGVRFCDRIVVVEKVGLYHNWTYIDGIEVYAFNGTRLELVQKRDYDKVHRNEEFIRKELETMVRNFFEGVLKAQRSCMPQEELEEKAKSIIDGCYKSFLDSDYNTRLTQILPQIEQNYINNAKWLLMERNHMTEQEAFRYIQKSSMDSGTNMVETAQMILLLNKYLFWHFSPPI